VDSNSVSVKIIAKNGSGTFAGATSAANFSIKNKTTISNLSISRAGDTAGSAVNLSWLAAPSGAVDVWTYAGAFSTAETLWIKQVSNYAGTSWKDLNQVTRGTQKYYKILPAGQPLLSSDLTIEVAGKFDIGFLAGPSCKLISLPFIPLDTNINKVIGKELTGSSLANADKVYYWSGQQKAWISAYLKSDGTWGGLLTDIEPDKGYFVNIQQGNPLKYVTFVGIIPSSGRSINLYKEFNMIGSSYPVSIPVVNSNLKSVLIGGTPATGDKIYSWDGTTWTQCYMKADGTFSGTLTAFETGKGYYIKKQGLANDPNPDIWNYPKPF
jgi:hypothetical protein